MEFSLRKRSAASHKSGKKLHPGEHKNTFLLILVIGS